MFWGTSGSLSNVINFVYSMCIVDGRDCSSQLVTGICWRDLCPNKELIL